MNFFEFSEKPPPLVYWKWCAYKVLWSKSAARSGVPIRSYTRKIAKIRSYARKWGGIIVTPPVQLFQIWEKLPRSVNNKIAIP